jgi:mono/diheme cytochrome c family protein
VPWRIGARLSGYGDAGRDVYLAARARAAQLNITLTRQSERSHLMRNFLLGIIFALVILLGGAYAYLRLGFVSFRADLQAAAVESNQAMAFVDASTDRHAPDQKNPIEPSEANLMEGVKLYKTYCGVCHGAPDHPEKRFGYPFYPPAPQFMEEAPDMPENQNFYIIRHGIRWSGMPAWQKTLSDEDSWRLVTFLSHMDKLPPAVEEEWKKPVPPGSVTTQNVENDTRSR